MVYKLSFKKLFYSLFLLFNLIYLIGLLIYVLFINDQFGGQSIKAFTENMGVWVSLLPKPILLGLSSSLVGAYMIQWSCKCKIIDEIIHGRNSIGLRSKVEKNDVAIIREFNISIFAVVRIKLKSKFFPVYVVKRAYEDFV